MEELEFELKQATLNELEDHLGELGEILNNQSYSDLNQDDFEKIFRIVHSIKGNTRASGFSEIAEVSHLYESKMIGVKAGDTDYSKPLHEMSLMFLDKLGDSLEVLKTDMDAALDLNGLLTHIENLDNLTEEKKSTKTDDEMSFMIVDDDYDVQEIVKSYISDAIPSKFQLEMNGKDALEKTTGHKFDVIICDYKMPVLDGKKFIEQLRSTQGPNQYTPIIFLSGYKPNLEANANTWENVFFIEKPFTDHKLIYYVKCSIELLKNLEAA